MSLGLRVGVTRVPTHLLLHERRGNLVGFYPPLHLVHPPPSLQTPTPCPHRESLHQLPPSTRPVPSPVRRRYRQFPEALSDGESVVIDSPEVLSDGDSGDSVVIGSPEALSDSDSGGSVIVEPKRATGTSWYDEMGEPSLKRSASSDDSDDDMSSRARLKLTESSSA
ncbi:hypothetical protein BSL78_22608 [Apostichopus japonicus]|uniref:Uncharacterized protein n=1 Tax=Stichopus japonicus TaxID=307972 RepID=A0A2G8JXU2_STIJA|nr:hypothetical protein BSL78_22608 [Apostichopus japonicus]